MFSLNFRVERDDIFVAASKINFVITGDYSFVRGHLITTVSRRSLTEQNNLTLCLQFDSGIEIFQTEKINHLRYFDSCTRVITGA
jgi:hypothetical protein